ncbi:prepilin peptidase (plasmid) [Yersinia massiliensis]|uniref:prepilin peptidase n=1 Tax=Yersinia massiliensis TaxID=419257 RepID=UPI00156266EA|nr:A24 family peptidase [Yersinia massiliensis]QKJ09430.1 prepilin peptidase [Yersinia massiliensis]
MSSFFLIFNLTLLLLLISLPLVKQAQLFLLAHEESPLRLPQIISVIAAFILAGTSLILTGLEFGFSPISTAKCLVLLAWGIPMVLLDLHKFWLPQCFTTGFWLTGLLFTFLPGSSLLWWQALTSSGVMFTLLYLFHLASKHLIGEEGFGLGDVHLIAALCAWLPWQLASVLSGTGFLLFITGAIVTRQYVQPYAPWLFILLAGLATGFPQLTLQGVL